MTTAASLRSDAATGRLRPVLILLALLLLPVLAFAQAPAAKAGGPRLDKLSIEIWPEYDRPAALVILRGVVAEGVKLPAAISLRLPANVDGAATVAYSTTAEGNLLNLKNEQAPGKDAVTVKFETPERFFHLEFYEPMATGDSARSFTYTWPGDIAVEHATVVVQEPAAALGLVTEPKFDQTSQGAEGLNYRIGELGALPAGKAVPIRINYTKSDSRPSVDIKGLRTAQPAPAAVPPTAASINAPVPPAPGGLPNWVLPVGGFAAFGIIVALLVALLWRRQAAALPTGAATAAFCKKCGTTLSADSAFCAKCGTKVGAR